MLYKGNFVFDKTKHAGECEIDDKNNIIVTINESDLLNINTSIVGYANSEYLTIHKPILINNGIGFYKLQAYYMIKYKIPLKYKSVDFSKHIREFRFTFEPLNEWLNYEVIKQNNNIITFDIPEEIILYNNDDLKIKVKYYKESKQLNNNYIENISVIPYICITTSKDMDIEKIKHHIQIVTRFFATLIGYTGNVNIIKFKKNYKGKNFFEKYEDDLIINCDFSNCFDIRLGYGIFDLRTSYKVLKKNLKNMFEKWFNIYTNSRFKESIINYFNPYKSNTLEEEFLKLTKCLEKVSIAKEDKKEKLVKNKELHKIIDKFYSKYKDDLISSLKDNNFKKSYISKIDEIHEEIANCIVYKYSHRIDLAKRFKDSDINSELKQLFDTKHITRKNKDLSIYNYLANTRNYYTHLDDDRYIIKDIYIPRYCRILEKLLIGEFLKLIIDDEKYLKETMKKDRYLTAYDYKD